MLVPSPCVQTCQVVNSRCIGCHRTISEIASWSQIHDGQRLAILQNCIDRRPAEFEFKDQLERIVTLPWPLTRVVSLVPSMTQTMLDLGLEDILVGVSSYCPQGKERKLVVGGTKNPRHSSLQKLAPQLVLANKEENRQEDVAKIAESFPIWVSDANSIEASLNMILALAYIFDRIEAASSLLHQISQNMHAAKNIYAGLSCAYLIWDKPLMVAGHQTLIHAVLNHYGLRNVFATQERYPETSEEELKKLAPKVLFLPDEPYEFAAADVERFSTMLPHTTVVLVCGKNYCWNGTGLSGAFLPIPELSALKR